MCCVRVYASVYMCSYIAICVFVCPYITYLLPDTSLARLMMWLRAAPFVLGSVVHGDKAESAAGSPVLDLQFMHHAHTHN